MIKGPCAFPGCTKAGWHRVYRRNRNYEKVNEGIATRRYRDRIPPNEAFICLKHKPKIAKQIHPKRMKKKSFSKGKKQK